MQVLFTRSEKPGSKLIRALTGEDISHVALVIDNGVVIHSTFTGVKEYPMEQFIEHNTIVHRFIYRGNQDTQSWGYRAIALKESQYDYLAFMGMGLRLLMMRTIGWAIPAFNHWATKGRYLCTEFVDTVLGEKETNDQLTPGQVRQQLRSNPQWVEIIFRKETE